MKYHFLLIYAFVGLTLFSCSESEVTAEEIEDEYVSEEHEDEKGDIKVEPSTPNTETAETSVINASELVHIEDYATIDTKAKLYEAFPADNLEDGSSWYGEGTVEYQHTVLTDPYTDNIYLYVWDDSDNETLSFLECHLLIWNDDYELVKQQMITSESGVFTGMTIKELYDWNNGEDFSFSGFGWDYEGGIFPQEGSKISKAKVEIKLALKDYTDQNYTHLLGDMQLSTADEGILDAPIVVDRLTLYVGNPEF